MALLCIAVTIGLYYYADTFPLESNKLSGSFSEFRGNHFHTGIDISTDGMEGYPVLAPADGYISYIKQDYLGYGKALFLNTDEHIYVFGHLQGFSPSISLMLNRDIYRQILYPSVNTIKVKEGDTIAYTGRSGTYIPHLHFEIRSMNNHPISPYTFFSIPDNRPPEIPYIVIEPADDTTLINGRHEVAIIKGSKLSEKYYNYPKINIQGTFKIYPIIIDRQLSQTARLFVHTVDIFSIADHIYHCSIDSVSFDMSSKSPVLFRSDLNFPDNHYIFNPHASLSWVSRTGLRILYSNIDTIITVTAMDFARNRTIATLSITGDKIHSNGPDEIKIHKVNNKLVVSCTDRGVHDDVYGFSTNRKGYLYYIFNTNKHIKGPLNINSTFIHYDFLCIRPGNSHYPIKGITVQSSDTMYCLFNTKNPVLDGLLTATDIMDYQLCSRYSAGGFKYIISGFGGYSLYMQNGDKFRFAGKLSGNDTVFTHYLQPFLIGRDIEKPSSYLLSRNAHSLVYALKDEVSGIDWRFIGDSNTVYNIPDPQKGTVEIHLRTPGDSIFIIRDMEGNRDTLRLL